METRRIDVGDAVLEVRDDGRGELVLLIQTALTADELLPVARQPALGGHRRLLTHRRGYAGSSPLDRPGSIAGDAADCLALLDAEGIERAHVVGLSLSCAVALQLAVDAPRRVGTLALIEPHPLHTSRDAEFRAANEELLAARDRLGARRAIDGFLTDVVGPGWREAVEAQLPGAAGQMVRDAGTFLDHDLPALLAWRPDPRELRGVRCPVLHLAGADSGAMFDGVADRLRTWLPHTEHVVIPGAGHVLALTHAEPVAVALAEFLLRHPLGTAGAGETAPPGGQTSSSSAIGARPR